MAKITVIGSFVADHTARVDRLPRTGETVLGRSFHIYPGGKGVNQCVAAARLGGDTEMIGMLGGDENGQMFRALLAKEEINAERVFSSDKPTASALVLIDAGGQNCICVIPSANYEFGFKELEQIDGIIGTTELIVLQLEMRLDVTEEIIRRAHGYGVGILLNPAPAVKLDDDLLKLVDYLTPNEIELSVLTGLPTKTNEQVITAAKALSMRTAGTVIATLGEKGALIARSGAVEHIPGYRVNAVDTVAAGDSFNGALAVALTEGKGVEEAVRFANAMGALTVQKAGAIPSLHTKAQLEDFIRNNKTADDHFP